MTDQAAFALTVTHTDEDTVIAVVGELDVLTAPAVRETVAQAMREPQSRVVLDLADASFVDSAGIGVITRAALAAPGRQKRFDVVNAQPNVHRVFEITGLAHVLGR